MGLLCIFQVYTGSVEFRRALRQLNETLKEENLKELRKIKDMHGLSKGEIVAGVGVHLIEKLIGNCTTNKTKSQIDCPCGCKGNVASSKKMWIGKFVFFFSKSELKAHKVSL